MPVSTSGRWSSTVGNTDTTTSSRLARSKTQEVRRASLSAACEHRYRRACTQYTASRSLQHCRDAQRLTFTDHNQYLTARKKLYSLLFTKHEQKTLLARDRRAYPLKVPKGWDGFVPLLPDPDRVPPPPIQYEYHKKTDFEFAAMAHGIAAQWGDDAAGMALRTKPGEDSDMAESIEGLGLSRQREGDEEDE